jgi:hypothetical protein
MTVGGAVRSTITGVLVLLAFAPVATASVGLGVNVPNPVLRVDARGNAEVSWKADGVVKTTLIPVTGPVRPGGKLAGPDVSTASSGPELPFQRVARNGPGGWHYGLQTWSVNAGPVEVRFSRWRGSPTVVTLQAEKTSLGIALSGVAKLGGKAIPTTSRTPVGVVQRQFVYLGAQVGGQWRNLGGVAVKPDGSYRRALFGSKAAGTSFRAAVTGPNVGTTYAPDATAVAPRP